MSPFDDQSVTCDMCKTVLPVAYSGPEPKTSKFFASTLGMLGWAKTESGWLCPNHSDRGPTELLKAITAGKT